LEGFRRYAKYEERRSHMERKESYRKELEARLKKWRAMLDDLSAAAEKTKKQSQTRLKHQINELREQFEKVEEKLVDLKEASSEAWHTIKLGIEKAAGDFKGSLDAVMGTKEIALMSEKTTKKKAAKKKAARSAKAGRIKKQYFKTKQVCRVTFQLPKDAAAEAKSVFIVGEFNNWNIHAAPMKKLRSGGFTITLDLEPGREYQFRYLIDDTNWENDWNADRYVKSPYGDSDNSVVVT